MMLGEKANPAAISRAPRGARGLKYQGAGADPQVRQSRPTRGAWIEIDTLELKCYDAMVAPLAGRVD